MWSVCLWPVTSHIESIRSPPPEASVAPSGESTTEWTQSSCESMWPLSSPVVASHTVTRWSSVAAAIVFAVGRDSDAGHHSRRDGRRRLRIE